jgi:hypothetical protein
MQFVSQVRRESASARKGAQFAADSVRSRAGQFRESLSKRVEGAGNSARLRSMRLAIAMIKLQRSAFDSALKAVARVQKQGEKLLKNNVQKASWLPPEGKDFVEQWSRTLDSGRSEFQKTVDKSFDLLRTLFERVEKQQQALVKKSVSRGSAASANMKDVKKRSQTRKKRATKARAPRTLAASENQPTTM